MKKHIGLQIEELIKKNQALYGDNVKLSEQIKKKDGIIAGLESRIAELTEQIENEKTIIDSLMTVKNGDGTDLVYSDSSELPANVENDGEKTDFPVEDTVSRIEVDDGIEKASVLIGKAVRECAKVCNEFAEAGGNNAKDLINLALGRTEVFKSEILQILSSDKENEEKFNEAETVFNTVKEYFDLLRSQI